jgi:hypothetical protein
MCTVFLKFEFEIFCRRSTKMRANQPALASFVLAPNPHTIVLHLLNELVGVWFDG